ncbi:MAG: hypothetical protein C0490_01660 [Marivirga sp.]|nr:hypothetical protein [Marivirga sp.]
MIHDKIIYTDGHTVTVTDSMFQVNKTEYKLNGITKHGLYVLKPHRLPGVFMVLVGIVLIIIGLAKLVPEGWLNDVIINNTLIQASTVVLVTGALIAFVGVLFVGLIRERYAVRIATAEGEKNVVISPHKEYITQIVDAISSAYRYISSRTNTPRLQQQ